MVFRSYYCNYKLYNSYITYNYKTNCKPQPEYYLTNGYIRRGFDSNRRTQLYNLVPILKPQNLPVKSYPLV